MADELEKAPPPLLSAKEFTFVDKYVACRDVKRAAVEAGFTEKEGPSIYRRKAVHAEITRRMGHIDGEVDKQIAKKRVVNVEVLDRSLMQVVTIPRKTLIETPSLATPKVNAIEMGYKRVGLLIDGNFVPDSTTGPSQEEAPRIYRAAEQTIITHQITETKQVTTQRSVEHSAPPASAASQEPKTIDADPWASF